MRTMMLGLLLAAALVAASPITAAYGNDEHHPGSTSPTASVEPTSIVMDLATDTDRYARAISLSRGGFSAGSAKHVVLVSGSGYTDGMVASALAGAYRSPVLLSPASELPSGLIRELRRLGTRHVHVIGSTSRVGTAVTSALKSAGFRVSRITGKDAFATSAAVARRVALVRQSTAPLQVLIVSPYDLGSAAVAAGYAYSTGMPILYVRPGSVPDDVALAIRDLRVSSAVVVGGETSIYSRTLSAIARRTPQVDTRVAGADRFETAHAMADFAIGAGWATADHITVVNGVTSLSDAVIAASLTGASRGVTVLVTSDTLPYYSDHFIALRSRMQAVKMVVVVGPTAAVSQAVRLKIATAAVGSEMDMTLMMPHSAGAQLSN